MASKKHKKQCRFKSSTDINNYNNFLLELDNIKQNTTIDLLVSGISLNKSGLNQYIKTVDIDCTDKNCDSKQFTGLTYLEPLIELTNRLLCLLFPLSSFPSFPSFPLLQNAFHLS